jgi:hypothetical protein
MTKKEALLGHGAYSLRHLPFYSSCRELRPLLYYICKILRCLTCNDRVTVVFLTTNETRES